MLVETSTSGRPPQTGSDPMSGILHLQSPTKILSPTKMHGCRYPWLPDVHEAKSSDLSLPAEPLHCLMQRSRLCTLYFELQQSGWNWSPAQLPACNVKALRIYCWATSYSVSAANTAKQPWLMREMTKQRQSLDRKGDAIVLQLWCGKQSPMQLEWGHNENMHT